MEEMKAAKQAKHIEIHDAIKSLEEELKFMQDLLDECRQTNSEHIKSKEPESMPSLLDILNNSAERILSIRNEYENLRNTLREILF